MPPSQSTLPDALPAAAFSAILQTPFGAFGIRAGAERIEGLFFLPPGTPPKPPESPLAAEAARQIQAWLDNADVPLILPLAPAGTAFQQRVWQAISAIPRGQTATYGVLSTQLRSAPRAVGQACGANPFPIVVPCHRVVSAAGIGGFANARDGYLLEAKRWLLTHEARR